MITNAVNWFEIAVVDKNRAKTFYEKVFEVSLKDLSMGSLKMAMFPWTPGGTNAAGALV